MEKWQCLICGNVFDEELGDAESAVPAGTLFSELPDDWSCPLCGAPKEQFERMT